MVQKIGKLIPQISIFFIILSLIKQILFFKNYNIPIKNFIGISELGLLIADDMFLFLSFLLALILFVFFLVKVIEPIIESKKQKLNRNNEENGDAKDNQPKKKTSWFKFHYILLIFNILVFIILIPLLHKFTAVITLITVIINTIVLIILTFFESSYRSVFPTALERASFITIITMIIYILLFTTFEIDKIDNGKYTGTYIKTETKEYTSNDSSYYIGKTEKYIFIYSKKDNSTDIIPTDHIIEFKLKSK